MTVIPAKHGNAHALANDGESIDLIYETEDGEMHSLRFKTDDAMVLLAALMRASDEAEAKRGSWQKAPDGMLMGTTGFLNQYNVIAVDGIASTNDQLVGPAVVLQAFASGALLNVAMQADAAYDLSGRLAEAAKHVAARSQPGSSTTQ